MLLRHLQLVDVRSYERATVEFSPGVTILVGPNAQGKTNLLEAVQRVATGGSHRVSGDGPLVRAGAQIGVIRCQLVTDAGRRRSVELEIGSGRRTRTRVDGQDVRRAAEAIGVLRVASFAPEDLAIVRGDPRERRTFLDDLLAQRRPAFAAARADYDRVLKQRNQLLKQIRSLAGSAREAAVGTIDAWTEQLVRHGTQILAARIAAIRALAAPVDDIYRSLADRPERIGLRYRSSALQQDEPIAGFGESTENEPESDQDQLPAVPDPRPIAESFRAALANVSTEERARGLTLVGPHRDDLELTIGALPARGYSSHGEAWSLALALKLATVEVLAEIGDRPVVLLDDVFAELDQIRRQRLADACADFEQVLVTAAVEADVPLAGAMIDVAIHDGVSTLTLREASDIGGQKDSQTSAPGPGTMGQHPPTQEDVDE